MPNEFQFIDYDERVHKFIDNWRSDDIRRFATEHPLSVEWKYYADTADYRVGYDVFCKIAVAESGPVAWMIIFCAPAFPIAINPIVVDPCFVSQGLGTRILREFIERVDEILPRRGDRIEVGIDVENIKSRRLLERLGFRRKGVHPDGDFEYYVKSLAQTPCQS
ncbi:MAG: GNAT family N-acetyltransferase [Oscillospiraceae bacterium]|jgi:RimJ/RimL family protein N-acetyltransferase|nr:GNAT family N-acetyltransferase [Oscillospiraceae bacterium]